MSSRNRRFVSGSDDDLHIERDVNGVDTYVFDPFNSLNKEITKEDITKLLKTYNIDMPINNFNLYRRAFVHRSYTKNTVIDYANNNIQISPKPNNCLPLYSKSNERLEFIGDGILECITKYYLCRIC